MPPPVVFPPLTEHKSTVIIIHGLGDSGNGYAPIVQNWQNNGLFTDTKFILPSAPAIPVTNAGGRAIPAWFDIRGERGPHMTFETLTAQPQDDAGLLRSRDYFLSLIRGEVDGTSSRGNPAAPSSTDKNPQSRIPASQVLVGGFSQGAVMSLLTGLTAGSEAGLRLGGVFCMSGYLALAEEVVRVEAGKGVGKKEGEEGGGGSMEVMMVHGDRDPIMNFEWAEKSADLVRDLGYDVDFEVFPGLGHSVSNEVLAKVTAFISRVQGKGKKAEHDEL